MARGCSIKYPSPAADHDGMPTDPRRPFEPDTRRPALEVTPAQLRAAGWVQVSTHPFPGPGRRRVLVFKRDGYTRTLVV